MHTVQDAKCAVPNPPLLWKADAQKSSVGGRNRPTADTCNMKVSGEVRPILLNNSIFFEVAGIRLEWPAGLSRISDAPGL
jgi:hypothetical protein